MKQSSFNSSSSVSRWSVWFWLRATTISHIMFSHNSVVCQRKQEEVSARSPCVGDWRCQAWRQFCSVLKRWYICQTCITLILLAECDPDWQLFCIHWLWKTLDHCYRFDSWVNVCHKYRGWNRLPPAWHQGDSKAFFRRYSSVKCEHRWTGGRSPVRVTVRRYGVDEEVCGMREVKLTAYIQYIQIRSLIINSDWKYQISRFQNPAK